MLYFHECMDLFLSCKFNFFTNPSKLKICAVMQLLMSLKRIYFLPTLNKGHETQESD